MDRNKFKKIRNGFQARLSANKRPRLPIPGTFANISDSQAENLTSLYLKSPIPEKKKETTRKRFNC